MKASAWRQAPLMLLAPWQWRRNDGKPWVRRLSDALWLLLLGAPAVAALWWKPPLAAWTSVGVCALLGLTFVWGLQFSALQRLDHPHAAHTVPGHTRALRTAALGLWLAIVALCGGVSALGAWMLLGHGLRVGLVVAVGVGTLLLLLALAIRWWWVWIALSVGPTFLGVAAWRNLVFGSWAWMQQQWQAQPLAVTLGVLLLQGLWLQDLFGSGDAGHARAYASRERFRKITAASAAGQKPVLAAYGRWGEWLGLPWQRLSDAWLAHACRRATVGPRSVMARAEIVLHGSQHWVRHLSTALMVQAVVVLCFVLTISLTGLDVTVLLEGGRVGISIGLTSMALTAVMSLPGALWQSRREQALLMLLPGMPQGVALNRALAWRQMRHCLWVWASLLPALSAMVWAGKGLTTLAFIAIALPMSAWLWRDVSRQRAARPAGAFGPVMLCVLAGAASMALLTRQPDALLPWAAGVLLLTASLLVWRWRRLLRLPQALPAGRLAS